MRTDTPQTVYLKDYTPPAFLIDTVDLDFDIEAEQTTVTATLAMRRNSASPQQPLVLDGEELETLSAAVDGKKVPFSANESTYSPSTPSRVSSTSARTRWKRSRNRCNGTNNASALNAISTTT
jgi:aminopeptidase N